MGQVTDPNLEGYSDAAFEEPGEGGLTREQLGFRIAAKREQAAQDAGWMQPPGPDAPLDQVETPEPPAEEGGEGEPEPEEPEPGPEEEQEPEEPEAEAAQEEPAEEDDFYVGSYRSREMAEEGLAEKDRTIDRLYKELYAREAQQEQQQQGPAELDVAAWNEWASDMVENGAGANGAMEALQQGGAQGFDIYMAHWVRDPEQAGEALAFNNEVQRQFAAQSAMAAISPIAQSFQQQNAVDEASLAKANVASRHDDFLDYEEEMDRIAAPGGPVLTDETRRWLVDVAQNTPGGKERAWEYLYMAAQGSTAPQRRKAKRVESARRKESSDAAKVQATVSSSEASGNSTPRSEAELAVIRKKNAIRSKLGQPLLPED